MGCIREQSWFGNQCCTDLTNKYCCLRKRCEQNNEYLCAMNNEQVVIAVIIVRLEDVYLSIKTSTVPKDRTDPLYCNYCYIRQVINSDRQNSRNNKVFN